MEIPSRMLQAYKIAAEENGIHSKFDTTSVNISNNTFTTVEATDGKRYIIVENMLPSASEDLPMQFTIKRRTAKSLACGRAKVIANEKKKTIEIEHEDGKLVVNKKTDDKFPHDARKLIPTTQPVATVTVDAKLLSELLSVVADISRGGESYNNNVILSIHEASKPLKIESEKGKFKTTAIIMPLTERSSVRSSSKAIHGFVMAMNSRPSPWR